MRCINMHRITLILLLLIFASSCTIQKRLHRPGWNVSWNKNYRSNSGSDISENKDKSKEKESDLAEVVEKQIEPESITGIRLEPIESAKDSESELEETIVPDQIISEKECKISEPSRLQKEIQKIKVNGNKRSVSVAGIFLLALAFVAIGAIIYTVLDPAETSDELTGKIFRSLFFACLALVFLFASLIGFAVTNYNRSNKVSPPKEKEKEVEKVKATKKDKTRVAIAFGVIIALILTVVLVFN